MVEILGSAEMPLDRLKKFIVAIEDIEDRKEAAIQWKDYLTALDVSFVAQQLNSEIRFSLKLNFSALNVRKTKLA